MVLPLQLTRLWQTLADMQMLRPNTVCSAESTLFADRTPASSSCRQTAFHTRVEAESFASACSRQPKANITYTRLISER